jgi:hypothetical protein
MAGESGDTPDFSTDRSTYLRHHEEVRKLLDEKSYMSPLSIRLWQGLADNWTPPGMTQQLAQALPHATVTTFEDLSHYSTLRAALPGIFNDLA